MHFASFAAKRARYFTVKSPLIARWSGESDHHMCGIASDRSASDLGPTFLIDSVAWEQDFLATMFSQNAQYRARALDAILSNAQQVKDTYVAETLADTIQDLEELFKQVEEQMHQVCSLILQ